MTCCLLIGKQKQIIAERDCKTFVVMAFWRLAKLSNPLSEREFVNFVNRNNRGVLLATIFVVLAMVVASRTQAQSTTNFVATNEIHIVEIQGAIDVLPKGSTNWVAAQFNHILLALVQHVADATERPEWNAGSFFKRFANRQQTF